MKIQAPKGMRDFYPEDWRLQTWLFNHWRAVSQAAGFCEFEGPIFEDLALYETKSGEGIVSELFHFEDRGGRHFANRPQMTPTLARMVAARANALPRPIKWFSIPRMCRAEKPQRGRLREFFQWNVDILGIDEVLADAEVISVAVSLLRRLGLTSQDVVVKLSSRALATAVLQSVGITPDTAATAFQLIDRAEKLEPQAFQQQWDAQFGAQVAAPAVMDLLATATLERCLKIAAESGPDGRGVATQFEELWTALQAFEADDFCEFDLRTVRGLAYYTGPVFEVRTRSAGLRALFGGGRYDNLTELLGGPRVTGVGFGAGDVPMLECLREFGKLPTLTEQLEVFVIDASHGLFPKVQEVTSRLRAADVAADFSYKRQALGKQLKQAAGRPARLAVIVGDEFATSGTVAVKDLATGEQRNVPWSAICDDARTALGLR